MAFLESCSLCLVPQAQELLWASSAQLQQLWKLDHVQIFQWLGLSALAPGHTAARSHHFASETPLVSSFAATLVLGRVPGTLARLVSAGRPAATAPNHSDIAAKAPSPALSPVGPTSG